MLGVARADGTVPKTVPIRLCIHEALGCLPSSPAFWASPRGSADISFFKKIKQSCCFKKYKSHLSPKTLNLERKHVCRAVQTERGVPGVSRLPEPAGLHAGASACSLRGLSEGCCRSGTASAQDAGKGQARRMLGVCNVELWWCFLQVRQLNVQSKAMTGW